MKKIVIALVLATACTDDPVNQTPKDASIDAPVTPDASCFQGEPVTHDQIINACTTSQKIYKNSKPPLLKADGSLPPLPQ